MFCVKFSFIKRCSFVFLDLLGPFENEDDDDDGGFREKSHNHTLQEARKSKKRNKEKDLVWQLTIQPIR